MGRNTKQGRGIWCLFGYFERRLSSDLYLGNSKAQIIPYQNDIGEQQDLASQHPEIVKQLSKEMSDYLRARSAQRPSMKTTGKIIPYPDEL